MPTALFLSPHLDDVVFSCGGLAALLAESGWHTVLATLFTRSVVPATGFALACQLDKGLAPDVDYMALRRKEDLAAAALLGFGTCRWLDLLEAPHRGYGSAPALFGPYSPQDSIAAPLRSAVAALCTEFAPDLVLVPQGLGNHVDHRRVIDAALMAAPHDRLAFYRDTPYAIRNPQAGPNLPDLPACTVDIGRVLERKVMAATAYTSQVGFQFGGPEAAGQALRAFALAEGAGRPAERFIGADLPGGVPA